MQSDVDFSVLQLAFHVVIGRIRLLSFFDSTILFLCSHWVFRVVLRFLIAVASLVAEHRLSVVVALRLSCSVACRIFLDEGSNPWFLRWQVDSYPAPPGKSDNHSFGPWNPLQPADGWRESEEGITFWSPDPNTTIASLLVAKSHHRLSWGNLCLGTWTLFPSGIPWMSCTKSQLYLFLWAASHVLNSVWRPLKYSKQPSFTLLYPSRNHDTFVRTRINTGIILLTKVQNLAEFNWFSHWYSLFG